MALWSGWTPEQLAAGIEELRGAIASGALNVKFGERSVTYRSLKELEQTLAQMTEAAAPASSPKRRIRNYTIHDRSGW